MYRILLEETGSFRWKPKWVLLLGLTSMAWDMRQILEILAFSIFSVVEHKTGLSNLTLEKITWGFWLKITAPGPALRVPDLKEPEIHVNKQHCRWHQHSFGQKTRVRNCLTRGNLKVPNKSNSLCLLNSLMFKYLETS